MTPELPVHPDGLVSSGVLRAKVELVGVGFVHKCGGCRDLAQVGHLVLRFSNWKREINLLLVKS